MTSVFFWIIDAINILICKYYELKKPSLMDKKLVKSLKALADPTRLKIVRILSHRENMCVCEIQHVLGITQPNASNHLKILENAEIVEALRDGSWVNYSLKNLKNNLKLDRLVRAASEWMDSTEELKELIEIVRNVDRKEIKRKN